MNTTRTDADQRTTATGSVSSGRVLAIADAIETVGQTMFAVGQETARQGESYPEHGFFDRLATEILSSKEKEANLSGLLESYFHEGYLSN